MTVFVREILIRQKKTEAQNGGIMVLGELQPKEVFHYFEEICGIAHGSGNVKEISDYCVTFAKEHNLKYRQDEKFNVLIWKDGTAGYENSDAIMLQGHLDMVAVKEDGCTKDMEKEGLDLVVEGDYVSADKTSLGGDDGIAVAYALALLDSKDIPHPPLVAVLTVDEEIGMLGAAALDLSDVDAHIMMNIDSEEEGIFLAGCAGGATVRCSIPVTCEQVDGVAVELAITGLTGGHSGMEIICQRANANVLMGRVLHEIEKEVTFSLTSINGGEKDNAIAKFCNASLIVEKTDVDKCKMIVSRCQEVIAKEYATTDPELKITATLGAEKECNSMNQASITKVLMALRFMPSGILKMSTDIKGLVQTSLNLGILNQNDQAVELCYSVRSSVSSEKDEMIGRLESLTEFLGGTCSISGKYPAWEYKKNSELRDRMVAVYEKMFGKKPEVQTIHAGVECGLMSEKIKDLDCVSFGPDIIDIHTTREKLSISSVKRTWDYTLEVLKEMK